jgi:hypothetical protein
MRFLDMTRKLLSSCLLIVALVGMSAPGVMAQRTADDTNRGGTAGSAYLLLPLTARMASLGSATTGGLSTMSGLEASYANPAGLALNTGTNAIFSRMNYVADIGVNYFGVAQRFGNNSIGLTVSSWDFGDIPLQTEDEPDITDLTWTANYVTAGITYARILTDRISAGITAKVINETIDNLSASGLAFDAGMNYTVGESGLRFGVSLKNFGSSLVYGGDGLIRTATIQGEGRTRSFRVKAQGFELPSLLNFGVTYSRPVSDAAVVNVLGNFRSNSFDEDQLSVGLEMGLMNILDVRGGYEWQSDLNDSFFDGWNVGAGLNLDVSGTRLQIDYAYRSTEFFDGVNMFTVNVVL